MNWRKIGDTLVMLGAIAGGAIVGVLVSISDLDHDKEMTEPNEASSKSCPANAQAINNSDMIDEMRSELDQQEYEMRQQMEELEEVQAATDCLLAATAIAACRNR